MTSIIRTKSRHPCRAIVSLLFAAGLHSPAVHAVDINAGFALGVGYSDNINRAPDDRIDETIARTGMALSAIENGRKLDLDIRGSLDYYDYLNDTYDSDVVGALDALVDVSIIEERLRWVIKDNYGRAAFDPFQPARPENWENINYLTTGPTIMLYQAGRNESGIDLRYSNMNYETRPFDNERRSGRFWIGREIRRNHTLSLNADTEVVEFDNGGLTPDYRRRSAFLRYEADTGRNLFSIDGGYMQQEILSQESDGIIFNGAWTRRISARSQLTLNASRQFSDQGNVFRYQQDITRDLDSIGDLTENGSPFLLHNADITYSLDVERTNFSIRIGASEQEYETQGELDRTDARAELFLLRDFTRSLYGSVDLRWHDREFSNIVRDDQTVSATLRIGYRLSAAFDVSISQSYLSRNSTDVANEFDEHRGDLLLTYSPAWGR